MSDKLITLAILLMGAGADLIVSLALAVLFIIYSVAFATAKLMHSGMVACNDAQDWIAKELSRHV